MAFPPIINYNPNFLAVLEEHHNDYDAAAQAIVTQHKTSSGLQEFSALVAATHDGFFENLVLVKPVHNARQSIVQYLQAHNTPAYQALDQPYPERTDLAKLRLVVATYAEAQRGFINKAILAGGTI